MRRTALVLLCVALAGIGDARAAVLGNRVGVVAAQARKDYEQGEYSEALKLYREALLQDPKSARLHFNAGDALYKMQDYEGAAKEYGAALQGDDAALRAQGMYNMGNARFQQQRFDQAAEAYQQALELESADQDAKANLELALERLQEQQQQGTGKGQDGQQDRQQQQDQQQDRPGQQSQDERKAQTKAEDQSQESQGQDRRMSKEEAERVLQALRDRELQGRLRRTPIRANPPDKDW